MLDSTGETVYANRNRLCSLRLTLIDLFSTSSSGPVQYLQSISAATAAPDAARPRPNGRHGSERARASWQVGRCWWLSRSSLLHGNGKPRRGHRGCGIFFQLGTRATRSRKIYPSLFLRLFGNRLE